MQEEKKKRLDKMINKAEESARRTTIILDKAERDFIDQMIKEGKESGIKQLISKMLEVYRSMMIYDWRFPGEYYFGISRMAFVNAELLNIIIQRIPKEKWGEIGKEIGVALKVSMETTLGLQAAQRENWENIFKRLRVQGFGDFYLKDKYLLLKTPFLGYPELWEGLLGGLFDVELDTKTSVPPLVFEIKTQKSLPAQ
jgi:hypothetical protein